MRLKSLSKSYTIVIHYSIYVIQGHKYFYKTANFIGSELVTRNFLSYTFRDVISNRFTTKLAHTADAALVASSLYINWLECFSSFFPLKTEVVFLKAVKSMGQSHRIQILEHRSERHLMQTKPDINWRTLPAIL